MSAWRRPSPSFELVAETCGSTPRGQASTIGRLDVVDGLFYFRYRKAERIRVRGEMVSGLEVEEGALLHPGLEENVKKQSAVGMASDLGEEDIRLFVTLKPGATCSEEDIRAHCRDVMAKFMVPAVVTVLDSMPRTMTGKPEKDNALGAASLGAWGSSAPTVMASRLPIRIFRRCLACLPRFPVPWDRPQDAGR